VSAGRDKSIRWEKRGRSNNAEGISTRENQARRQAFLDWDGSVGENPRFSNLDGAFTKLPFAPVNIFVAVQGLSPALRAELEQGVAGHVIGWADTLATDDARKTALATAEVIFGNVPAAWLAPTLPTRWIQLDSAGVDAYLRINDARRDRPITVTNLSGFYDRAVAEATLAGILAFFRRLPELLRAQPEQRWIKTDVEPNVRAVHRSKVVILGAGSIGRRLAALLTAFEAVPVLFARHHPAARLHSRNELDVALKGADIVINTLPHTAETIGLIDRERIGRMKADALFVNVGRGSAVDEPALVDALNAGRLGGAVLDVTALEPLPPDSPLWVHPRVILTQHTGGRFPGEARAKIEVFLGNFRRFVAGGALENVVDLARGY
jgi:phosphoglycerate dehydrogenase-like enzyme